TRSASISRTPNSAMWSGSRAPERPSDPTLHSGYGDGDSTALGRSGALAERDARFPLADAGHATVVPCRRAQRALQYRVDPAGENGDRAAGDDRGQGIDELDRDVDGILAQVDDEAFEGLAGAAGVLQRGRRENAVRTCDRR